MRVEKREPWGKSYERRVTSKVGFGNPGLGLWLGLNLVLQNWRVPSYWSVVGQGLLPSNP